MICVVSVIPPVISQEVTFICRTYCTDCKIIFYNYYRYFPKLKKKLPCAGLGWFKSWFDSCVKMSNMTQVVNYM